MLSIRSTSFLVALISCTSAQAAVTITSDAGINTPGLPGFRTYTLTAASDGAPIQGFDFVGDPSAPVDPLTSRGIFGTLNQLSLPGGLSTVWSENNPLIPILLPGPPPASSQQDTQFLFNSTNLLVIPGSARESSTSLQAAFSTSTDFGQSVQFAQIVTPDFGGPPVQLRGVVGTTDGMEFPVSIGGGPPPLPPLVVDANLGDETQGTVINHTFATSAGDLPITWHNLLVSGSSTPAIAPTFTANGLFNWNSAGSPLGQYNFDVTATNSLGSDVGRLSLNLVAPPLVPVITDAFAEGTPGDMFMHTFQATGEPPFVWSALENVGPIAPAIAPTLSSDGKFAWNSTGSNAPLYTFRVTATNVAGMDTGQLVIELTSIPPVVVDVNLGDRTQGSVINHSFTTEIGTPPITWSNLLVTGAGTPAIAPTLTSAGAFSWNSAGSPLGLYNFDVTATNGGGSDVGRLSLNLVTPPPAAPVVVDSFNVGEPGDIFMHTFQTSVGDPPITWSNLESIGPLAPNNLPTLTADGKFAWDSTGSAAPEYIFRVTATNSVGSDTGQLTIYLGSILIPEPATATLLGLAMLAVVSRLTNRRYCLV